MAKNGQKWQKMTKNDQKWPKMAKNDQKWPKMTKKFWGFFVLTDLSRLGCVAKSQGLLLGIVVKKGSNKQK